MEKESLKNQWWGELNHSGMFFSPAVIEEMFPKGLSEINCTTCGYPIDSKKIAKLKESYTLKFRDANQEFVEKEDSKKLSQNLHRWIDALFQEFLGIGSSLWEKEPKIPDNCKYITNLKETLSPSRVLTSSNGYRYYLKILNPEKSSTRLGIGKGRQDYAKFVELLRKTKIQIGILTNGTQIRLIYAGLDHESWVEWDVTQWFESESSEDLLNSFYLLCGRHFNLEPKQEKEGKWPLLYYAQYSRIKQSDLSSVLGEQVREAVEILLESLDQGSKVNAKLMDPLEGLDQKARLNALYQASIRLIMRMVVIFFAEARNLFPKDSEKYYQSFGLEGLYKLLTEAEQEVMADNLRNTITAWPRLLSLFRLIYEGSPFPDIAIFPYGGMLFRSGDANSSDLTLKALSIFENSDLKINDFNILCLLRKLKVGQLKVKRAGHGSYIPGVVDFSELSAEYIGMIYEGLLDYQVRQVSKEEEAIIILKLGKQPALPFSRLKSLSPNETADLVKTLKKEKTIKEIKSEDSDDEDDGGSSESNNTEEESELEEQEFEFEESSEIVDDQIESENLTFDDSKSINDNIKNWAIQAVQSAKLVKKGKKSEKEYNEEIRKTSDMLYYKNKIYVEGQYYVIQSSGNRKGSGTFYTKPQLVIPTVQRTLEPLVFIEKDIPKKPSEILSLKILDPAMGSASFLVASLRYLSDILYVSLDYYNKIEDQKKTGKISIPLGNKPDGNLKEDIIDMNQVEKSDLIELHIKSRLKLHLLENCIYGVDINPLAVELAKLSLWVETLDRSLPFSFIDHKIKVGNSMIGSTLNLFQEYPIKAWFREAGDANHQNGNKFHKKELTENIKNLRNQKIKNEMISYIKKLQGQTEITQFIKGTEKQFNDLDLIRKFYTLNDYDLVSVIQNSQKEKAYYDFLKNIDYRQIKFSFDLWCSIWFWPPNLIEKCPTPLNFFNISDEQKMIITDIADKLRFFHWELEYPDVFLIDDPGFDAILGNPPWEMLQSSSLEYFSEYDPIFRTYSNQEQNRIQSEFFNKSENFEVNWLNFTSYFKAIKNWVENLSNPFGDYLIGKPFNFMDSGAKWRESNALHDAWRHFRNNKSLKPFQNNNFSLQGSGKPYTYKIFMELCLKKLKKHGRIGIILPSNIYGDKGTKNIREYLFEFMNWEYLFSFENSKRIFASIHPSFKFCIIIAQNGFKTQAIKTAFMMTNISDWENPLDLLPYNINTINEFSPLYKIFFEITTRIDLKLLQKMWKDKIILGGKDENNWGLNYYREMNPTEDSKYFPSITKWEEKKYIKNNYNIWIGPGNDIALPIYVGRMAGQYDFCKKGWVSGHGRTSKWEEIPFESKTLQPEFLISKNNAQKIGKFIYGHKAGYMKITAATNVRTVIAFLDYNSVHTDTCPVIYCTDRTLEKTSLLVAILNSFIFDYIIRNKLSTIALTYFCLEETPLPYYNKIIDLVKKKILFYVSKLSFIHISFAPQWIYLSNLYPILMKQNWKQNWAISFYERQRIRVNIEAIIAYLYDIEINDLKYILRFDADNKRAFSSVDKNLPDQIKLNNLVLDAYLILKQIGIERFCIEEWHYSNEIQKNFKENLGSEFLDFQILDKSIDKTWEECENHAKLQLSDQYERFLNLIKEGKDPFAIFALESENNRVNKKEPSDQGSLDKSIKSDSKVDEEKKICDSEQKKKKTNKSIQKKLI